MPSSSELWTAVDHLAREATIEDLRAHRLHLLTRAGGLVQEERAAAATNLLATSLLELVRKVCDGPILLMKGPEAAARYPHPHRRVFHDLDLLVPNARASQQQLLDAGFEEVGEVAIFSNIHHERPLWRPASGPVVIELHSRPKWLDGIDPPPFEELLAAAVPSATRVDGILAPSPAHHALLLAAHTWSHVPLGRLSDLVDVAAVSDQALPGEIEAVAKRWGVRRLWKTTHGVVEALFFGGPRTWAQRIWARNLDDASERTVLGTHLERWLSPFWGLPFGKAVRASVRALSAELEPAEGETWAEKWQRIRRAIRNAFMSRSEHARRLGPAGDRRRRKR